MKNNTLIIALVLLALSIKTNAQTWDWARSCNPYDTSGGYGMAWSVATDSHGNSYEFMLYIGDSVQCGSIVLYSGSTTLQNSALIKYDTGGNVIWAKTINMSIPFNLVVDKADNIYIGGVFGTYPSGPTGGSITLDSITLTAITTCDYFVAKLNPEGQYIWAQNNGATSAMNLAVDNQCNIYIDGNLAVGTMHFGTDSITTAGANTFLVKIDSAGTYQWSRIMNGLNTIQEGLSVDKYRNVFISGYFSGRCVFAGDTLRNSDVSSPWWDDFIVKYDSTGTPQWATMIPVNDQYQSRLSNDSSGNLYIVSTYGYSSLIIGSDTINNSGSLDGFVAKYNTNGTVLWAIDAGGTDLDYGYGISVDPLNNIWFSGGTRSTTFNIDTLSIACDISTNGSDYIAELDSNGNAVFLTSFRTGAYNLRSEVGSDRVGNIFFSGTYMNGNCIIGNDTLPQTNVVGAMPNYDFFLARIGDARLEILKSQQTMKHGNQVVIFPNPATQSFTVTYSGMIAENATVSVFNMEGQVIGQYKLEQSTVVNAEKFVPGIYLCRVENNGEVSIQKVVVE